MSFLMVLVVAGTAGCGNGDEGGDDGTGGGHIIGDAKVGQSGFTKWGWPLPYEQVSAESVKWLKEKGWWPVTLGYQSPASGQNNIGIVMWQEGLLERRGVRSSFRQFTDGVATNEAFLAGDVQAANAGPFPTTTMLARKAPVKVVAVTGPNLVHAMMVPKDSELNSIQDLKGSGATVGLVAGSSAEFYLTSAAKVAGLDIGRDVTIKSMLIPDQQTMPKGIDVVIPWDPAPSFMENELENARAIDTIFPVMFQMTAFYVHEDLINNVPDAVQAILDAFEEAILLGRYDVEGTIKDMKEDPNLQSLPESLLKDQHEKYNNLYKPTHGYPFGEFWSTENGRIAEFLRESGRLDVEVTAEDWANAMDPSFMDKTFEKLGWKVPDRPPWIPADWRGEVGQVPYPPYGNVDTLQHPQPWPERGDLTKEWEFNGETYRP